MPLHMTKIAYGCANLDMLADRLAGHGEHARIHTRYRPTRWEECVGGSLYWIHEHNLVARSPITGFTQQDNGRWFIDLEPRLIAVLPKPKRAHQGWRYLSEADAPKTADGASGIGDLPPELYRELAAISLI